MVSEGVIRFSYTLQDGVAPTTDLADMLSHWRSALYTRESIGGDLSRYGAYYGNISVRVGPPDRAEGAREFVVSCTQTGDDPYPAADCYCRVIQYSHAKNHVLATGPCAPSSESLTHAAMYDASPAVRAIVHGHDAVLWNWLQSQDAPATAEDVDYGTVEMAIAARAVVTLGLKAPWVYPGVLSMNGHRDGVVAWGADLPEAVQRYLAAWEASRGMSTSAR